MSQEANTPSPAVVEALRHVRGIIAEAASTGFNWKDGDWAERLFASQQTTAAALAQAGQPQEGWRAASDVLAERRRQIEQEGWSAEHDEHHDHGEMAIAAACYAAVHIIGARAIPLWPWAAEWWKPRSHRENLVRAGALILAEIERLDRATPPSGAAGGGTDGA